jgi:nidogen (entactin)
MFKLYISILLTIISTAKSIPNHFHPYGVSFGDVILPENDDGSVIISLGAKIKYFSNDFQKLFVNTNGVISFLFPTQDFVPIKFPALNPLIAPFWTDLTTLNGGKIFYRESTNINDLKQAKILTTSAGFTSFDPTRVFIITWDKVPAYGISSANSTNTFQTVIAISETSTFLNFNYDSLQIFSKSITIGGNMGDGINFYEFPVNFTRNVSNLVSQSNVNVPGKWLLQVDKFNINLLNSLPAPALQVPALEV